MKSKLGVIFFIIIGSLAFVKCGNTDVNTSPPAKNDSLKSVFQNSFHIGAAINENQLTAVDKKAVEILDSDYNTISPENCMKWMYLEPEPNVFDFKISDQYVAFGQEHDMFTVGHTLLWHSQIADFMQEVKDSAVMSDHIANHVKTIVTRYKGKIDSWDVLNEALNEDGTLRNSIFLQVIGDNYIEQVFRFAYQSDHDVELVYNDYNLCNPAKREGVVRMVKGLQDKGVKIDGVGMQGHWGLTTPSLEEIEKSIVTYAGLGVKVSISELDITVLPNPWDLDGAEVSQNYNDLEGDPRMNPYPDGLPEAVHEQLAQRYQDIFKIFLKHQDKLSRVTFWGVTDGHTWLNNWPINGRSNYPLLFDRDYKPKKAYYSLLELKK